MPSTINPSTIDPTKPTTGTALTQDVRDNEQATQDNFTAAVNDINALESGTIPNVLAGDGELLSHDGTQYTKIAPGTADGQIVTWVAAGGPGGKIAWQAPASAGHVILDNGTPVPVEPAVNYTGNAVNLTNTPGVSTNVNITNANAVNLPGGVGIYKQSTGADPITVELYSLESSDASITFQVGVNTIDMKSTGGAGGGQSNTSSNAGVGGIDINLPKNGDDLPKKSMISATATMLAVADGGANNRVEFSVLPGGINHQALSGAGSNTHAQIDSHIGDASIHYSVAVHTGAGMVLNGSAHDVGAGDGIAVTASAVAVDATVARLAADTIDGDVMIGSAAARGMEGLAKGPVGFPLISAGTAVGDAPTWSRVDTDGIQDVAVTFGKMQAFAADTILMRSVATPGAPADTKISALLNHTPVGTDYLLVETAAGLLRHSLVSSLPGGGGGIAAGTPFVVGDLMAVESDAGDGSAESVGFSAADVARLDIANTFAASQTILVAAGNADDTIQSGTGSASFGLFPGNGTVNERRFTVTATAGSLFISPLLDGGTPIGGATTSVDHGTGAWDVPDVAVAGTPVLLPDRAATIQEVGFDATPSSHASVADFTPSYTANQFFAVTGAGTFAINVPVDGSHGSMIVSIPAAATVSLPGWTVTGSEPAGVARQVALSSDANGHFARW